MRATSGHPGPARAAFPRDLGAVLETSGIPLPNRPGRRHADGVPGLHALAWAASGGMWLTGWEEDEPLVPPVPLLRRVHEAADAITAFAPSAPPVDVNSTLFGRAALLGHERHGRLSAGGASRLLEAIDGWFAFSLARPEDAAAVAAVVGKPIGLDPWGALSTAGEVRTAGDLAMQGQLLGIPAAALGYADLAIPPIRATRLGRPATPTATPIVVDLSAMWAGPLCAHLLQRTGATVVSVESTHRPDASRLSSPAFYAHLHQGCHHAFLELDRPAGVDALRRLLDQADIVIEASRPRALRQLGIDAEAIVAGRAGVTWVNITGYGRDDGAPDGAGRVAFGDDAAVAGGLVAFDRDGQPTFCGDAIGDPLTGLYAAVGALASHHHGGGNLLDVPMAAVAAHVARPSAAGEEELAWITRRNDDGWVVEQDGHSVPVAPPRFA